MPQRKKSLSMRKKERSSKKKYIFLPTLKKKYRHNKSKSKKRRCLLLNDDTKTKLSPFLIKQSNDKYNTKIKRFIKPNIIFRNDFDDRQNDIDSFKYKYLIKLQHHSHICPETISKLDNLFSYLKFIRF